MPSKPVALHPALVRLPSTPPRPLDPGRAPPPPAARGGPPVSTDPYKWTWTPPAPGHPGRWTLLLARPGRVLLSAYYWPDVSSAVYCLHDFHAPGAYTPLPGRYRSRKAVLAGARAAAEAEARAYRAALEELTAELPAAAPNH